MLTTDEARALITTSLDDAALADVIAREEAWLARRIGPLEGERVETFITLDGDEVLQLTRPTSEVVVEDDQGVVADAELRGWSDVVLDSTASWSGDVTVTYSTSDEDEVKRALITLVRLTINETAYLSQTSMGYSASVSLDDQRTQRYAAWRSLLRPRQPTSMRIRSTIPYGGKTIASVATEASAS